MTELRIGGQLDAERVILRSLFPANLLVSTEKVKPKPGETSTKIQTWLTYSVGLYICSIAITRKKFAKLIRR